MIAATRLTKAQANFERSDPYAKKLSQAIFNIARSHSLSHWLFTPHHEVKNVHLIVFTSDRGMCGPFNGNILKKAAIFCAERKHLSLSLSFFGKRGYDHFRKRDFIITNHYAGVINKPSFGAAQCVAEEMIGYFRKGAYDEVYLLYNEFKSAVLQIPLLQPLLPMGKGLLEGEAEKTQYIFEPQPDAILDELVDRSVKLQIYRALLNSSTSEHAARMTAMDSASRNCEDLIEKFTLERNKARQASITKELVEIVSGAESLK